MTEGKTGRRHRVVQWATGNIGTRALRMIIEHPKLDLVGVYVHSPDKDGRDAGDLCGLPPVGVKATRNIDDIVALKPDCVLYMPQGCDFDEICTLLSAGINVISTRTEFHCPRRMDPAIRDRVEQACRKGGATIHSTGSSPGFITEAMPLVLTSIQRRLDRLTIDEFANLGRRDSPDMLFKYMGYGQDPAQYQAMQMQDTVDAFSHSLSVIADAIGLPFDSVEVNQEVATARQDTTIVAGLIPKGTIGALRTTVSCLRAGKPFLQMRLNWFCTTDLDADWDLEETGWRVQVEGDAPLDVRIRFPIAFEDFGAVMPGLTAHRPVNAIPYVCAAPPGIKTTVDLPQIIADLSPVD